MANDVATGNELDAYQGNSGLAGADNYGYKSPDLAPLERFALNAYNFHVKEYEQRQKDKQDIEDHFMDESQYGNIDEPYAEQLQPLIDRQKELAKKNLQNNPNSKEWYEFHNNFNEIRQANAKLKTVQKLKDDAKDQMGKSADPHEKERLDSYIKKLDGYKLGEEVPVYDKYFAFDQKHIPSGETVSGTKQLVKGNKLVTVKYSSNNAMNLDKKGDEFALTQPESAQTAKDIAHTLTTEGGLPELNQAIKDAYGTSLQYNIANLKAQNKDAFDKYKKANPTATDRDALNALGLGDDLQKIYDGHKYLVNPQDPTQPLLQYVSAEADKGVQLPGFTYSADGTKRLNIPDNKLLALMGATQKPAGSKEEVIKEELSKTPAEIELLRQKAATEKSKQGLNAAKARNVGKATANMPTLPPSEVPLIGREGTIKTITDKGVSRDEIHIPVSKLSKSLQDRLGYTLPDPPKAKTIHKFDAKGKKIEVFEVPKAEQDAYDRKVAEIQGKGTVQMRFYDSKGNDITNGVINAVSTKKATIEQFATDATKAGMTIKFIDKNGNIAGTTETIDAATLKDSNKGTKKGQAPIGTELPADDNTEE